MTEQDGHTPGPWVVEKTATEFGEGICWEIRTAEDDLLVAELDDLLADDEANAKLMAAAPDLLDAIEDVFRLMDEGFLVRNIEDDGQSDWAIKALPAIQRLQKAQAAVRKAR